MARSGRIAAWLLHCTLLSRTVWETCATEFEPFSATYLGVGASVGSQAVWRIEGLQPRDRSGLPAYVWITGWTNSFFAEADMTFLLEMAKRGFVAAQVAYEHFGWTGDVCAPLDTADRYAHTKQHPSVSARTKAKSLVNALDVLCATRGADCSKGVAVHGFSMGTWLAALLPMYDSRVTALLLFGYGVEKEPQDCLSSTSVSVYIDRSRRRVINGVNDQCFTKEHNMSAQLESMSGYDSCSGNDCLQKDGSGYYFVTPAEYTKGEDHENVGTHLFFRAGLTSESKLFPSFIEQPSSWAMKSNFDWLAKAAAVETLVASDVSRLDANLERFSTTYTGVGDSVGSEVPWRIEGVRPKYPSGVPAYAWITGWTNSFFADADMTFILEMAKRGFVAAQVAYEHLGWTGDVCARVNSMDRYAPTKQYQSVSARTKAKSLVKAVDVLCETRGADCSKGVAVHGFSMGTWIAVLLSMYDSRITALLLFGYGIEKEPQDCLSSKLVSLYVDKSRRRIVNGENDQCFTIEHDMNSQLQMLSGYDYCTGRNCLQFDGSGYFLVSPFDYMKGERSSNVATHLFFRESPTPASDLFSSFVQQPHDAWGLKSNMDWLAEAALVNSHSADDMLLSGGSQPSVRALFVLCAMLIVATVVS
eukprot:TRINITY_DN10766_c0_g2_i2.p1 TRINITY_DN10766_c0_g2~~TRINITY_DN10766_c0_g2_i2.p1  ORF type:complete len:645 (-),score=87.73 TRINITY_DN10766_c0_g2_i2:105-2039(-)